MCKQNCSKMAKEHHKLNEVKRLNAYQSSITQRAVDNGYVDCYDIDVMFPLCNSALYHARKKLMAPGSRSGGKSLRQDIEEAIWSLQEALKLLPKEE